jgi:hypothetical protein
MVIYVIKKTIVTTGELSLHMAFYTLHDAMMFIKTTCTSNISVSTWEGDLDNVHFEVEEVTLFEKTYN